MTMVGALPKRPAHASGRPVRMRFASVTAPDAMYLAGQRRELVGTALVLLGAGLASRAESQVPESINAVAGDCRG